MSPSNRVAGPPGGLDARILRAAFTMLLVLAAPAPLRAQDETDWVGKRVVPRARDFVLRNDDEPVEPSRKAIAIYRVEQAEDGTTLRLAAEGQRLTGSARIAEILPVERAVDFFTDQIRVHPRDAFSYAMRALVRHDRKEFDAALQDYDQAIRLDPGNAQLHYRCAGNRHSRKEFARAIGDYTEAIRLDPRSALAYVGRALSWGARNDHDKAIEDLSEAIWLDPLCIPAYLCAGWNGKSKGESRKAIVDYNMVIRLDPENAPAFARRGLAWQALKSYAKAVADFEAAIQLDSEEALAFNGLAWIRATCPDRVFRDGKKAVESAATACELSAWKNASYLATLAAAHAESGDFDSAVKWQSRANVLDPTAEGRIRGEARLKLYRDHKPYREPEP